MMNLNIKYFGQIADITEKQSEQLEIDAPVRVENIISVLNSKYAQLKSATYAVAVNHQISDHDTPVHENSELALLPPFAGG